MLPRRWMLASVYALAGSVAPLAAQSGETAALRVRVTDAATGAPVEGAQVGFPELARFRLANAAGIAQIVDIPPGVRTLEVTMLGYGKATKTILLEAHALATGDVGLTSEPIEIEGLTVTTSQQIKRLRDTGFYTRDRMGHGYQLGPLEIASMIAVKPSDYFVKIPTVQLMPITPTGTRKKVVSRRSCETLSSSGVATPPETAQTGSFGQGGGQTKAAGKKFDFVAGPGANDMALFLDGVPYYDELDLLPIDMIEAIEVYVGAEVPMQFSSAKRAECGVVLLWSK